MDYLKVEQVKGAKFRVLAIPYGGPKSAALANRPENGLGFDLDDEYFSPRTDIKPDWFDRRPLVWHHNLDENLKVDADSSIGTADDLEQEDDGWWTTIWLDRSHRYWEQVNDLLSRGKVFGSSGTLPNFAKTDKKTGEILVWPYIEQTLTPTPANFYSVVTPMKAVTHFDEAAIGLPPAVRGIFTDLDSATADLGPDLASAGGLDPAMRERLVGELARLGDLLKTI